MEFQIVKNKYQRRQEKKNTNNTNQFEKLPGEIIAHIFSFFTEGEDLLDCSRVCTRFNAVIKYTPSLLQVKQKRLREIMYTWYYDSDDDRYDYDDDKPTYEYKGQTYYYNDRD